MRRLGFGVAVALWLLTGTTQAATPLEDALTRYFQQQQETSRKVSVSVLSSPERLPACEAPVFSQPSVSRRWGKLSVAAQCPQKKSYLQVEVRVTGAYPVAKRPISRGQALHATDFRLRTGRLDQLPATTLLNPDALNDAVALRPLVPGQAVTASMIRRSWKVKAGQTVQVLADGEGFNVSSEGKALNNAAVTETVRVRMPSGQVVSGKVDTRGGVNLLF